MYIKTQIQYVKDNKPIKDFENVVKIYNISEILINVLGIKITKSTHKIINYNNVQVFLLDTKPILKNIILIPTKYEKDLVFIDTFCFSIEKDYLFLRDIKLIKDFIYYVLTKTNLQIIFYDDEQIKLYIPFNNCASLP